MVVSPRRIAGASIAACVAGWLYAGDARADGATADALFNIAKELMDKGQFEEACPKFEASYEADRTLGTLLNIANCYEQGGRIATAWARWGEAMELARRLGDDRIEFAAERREALQPRLPKLTVNVDDPSVPLTVMRDDTRLEAATFGVSLPVDPGQRVIRVLRGDKVLHQEAVTLVEAQAAERRLSLRDIEAANKEVKVEIAPTAPPPAPAPRTTETSTQLIVGFVVGGVGVSGLIAAGVFGGVALSHKGDADSPDACVGQTTLHCSQAGIDSLESAGTFADLSQWVGIGSILVTAVGITLIVTSPSADSALEERASLPSAPRAELQPWVGPSAGGVGVVGRF